MSSGEALPMVSVVVPAFNAERTLGALLKALKSQSYPKDRYEVLVVDNNSTDKTAQVAEGFGVSVLRERERQSSYAARNRGIQAARGSILAFTDADCAPDPNWIRFGVGGFSEKSVGCVAGEVLPLPPKTLAQRYCAARHSVSQRVALEQSFMPYAQTDNAFYSKEVLESLGGFDSDLVNGGDADLGWRMQLELKRTIRFVPESVVYHEHRKTLRGLLKQRQAYGYGSVLRYRKHKTLMGPRKLKETYWEFLRTLRRIGRLLRITFVWLLRGPRNSQAREEVLWEAIEFLTHCARKWGQLKGSIRHGVWYV